MLTKKVDLSPQVMEAISRVLSRGETAQVKYNERDKSVKVFGIKMKLEKEEKDISQLSTLAQAVLKGEKITSRGYE